MDWLSVGEGVLCHPGAGEAQEACPEGSSSPGGGGRSVPTGDWEVSLGTWVVLTAARRSQASLPPAVAPTRTRDVVQDGDGSGGLCVSPCPRCLSSSQDLEAGPALVLGSMGWVVVKQSHLPGVRGSGAGGGHWAQLEVGALTTPPGCTAPPREHRSQLQRTCAFSGHSPFATEDVGDVLSNLV